MSRSTVPYRTFLKQATSQGRVNLTSLVAMLETVWISEYYRMCRHAPQVLQFRDGPFEFLFDHASMTSSKAEDRLVVAYGRSAGPLGARDASRMKGFLGGGIEIPGKGTFDKGHAMAHASGGGLDVNLFPQRRELNRGWSADGKVYREMERYCAEHPGTFAFSRLIYTDLTWVPAKVEYGVLEDDSRLWVEEFLN